MIIKTTFNDNDYTQVLESYWNRFWFDNYYKAIKDIEDLKEYRDRRIEAEDLLEKAFYHPDQMTVKDVTTFEKIIRNSILAYVKEVNTESYKYLADSLYVSVVLSVEDKDENGEVVYYFLTHKKYIVM